MKIRPCSDQFGTKWFDEFDRLVNLDFLEAHKNFRALLDGLPIIVTFEEIGEDDEGEYTEVWIARAMDASTLEWVVIANQLLEVIPDELVIELGVVEKIRERIKLLPSQYSVNPGVGFQAKHIAVKDVHELLDNLFKK